MNNLFKLLLIFSAGYAAGVLTCNHIINKTTPKEEDEPIYVNDDWLDDYMNE